LCVGDRDLISNQVVAEYRSQFSQLTGMSLSAVPMRQAQLPRLTRIFALMEHDWAGILDGIHKAPSVAVNEHRKKTAHFQSKKTQCQGFEKLNAGLRRPQGRPILPKLARTGEDR
jgi:hypothetical protein